MPACNCGKYISAAIECVRRQTFKNFELIIIDDGSVDNSLNIIEYFAARDSRIQFRSRANTGIVGALNEALQMANGEFIARMDADDLCDVTRLEKQLTFLRANPTVVALGTGVLYTDPQGRSLFAAKPHISHDEIAAGTQHGNSPCDRNVSV